jgi:TPR repeat protein
MRYIFPFVFAIVLLSFLPPAAAKEDEGIPIATQCKRAYWDANKSREKDFSAAVRLCGAAIKQGEPTGYDYYALMYATGDGFKKDKTKSNYYNTEYYKIHLEKAQQGNPESEMSMYYIYQDNIHRYPVQPDREKAFYWLERAANHEPCDPWYLKKPLAVRVGLEVVSDAYMYGKFDNRLPSGRLDPVKAFHYYQRLANEFGTVQGYVVMARAYEKGMGAPKDLVKALAYYRVASSIQYSTIPDQLAVRKQMTLAEVNEADRLVQQMGDIKFRPKGQPCENH